MDLGHIGAIRGSYLGLIGAGIGAVVVPSRKIPEFTVSNPLGALGAAGAIIAGVALLIWLGNRLPVRAPS